MRTLAKSIVFIFLLTITLAALLFMQPVTEKVTQLLLSFYLQQEIALQHCRLSLEHYRAEGRIGKHNIFAWDVDYSTIKEYKVILSYHGDINAFAQAADAVLPHIQGHFQAYYQGKNSLLEINATLLDGNASVAVDVDARTYRYALEGLDIASFLLQQQAQPFAGGTVFLYGNGVIKAPYTSDFVLTSSGLQLKKPLMSALLPDQKHPIPAVLRLRGSVDTTILDISADLDSPLAQIQASEATYGFKEGNYRLALFATNKKIGTLPVNDLSLHSRGTYIENALKADVTLNADQYRIKIADLAYRHEEKKLSAEYRLTTEHKKPVNLSGENALFGALAFAKGDLMMSVRAKAMIDPLLLTIEGNRLEVISNNIPLKTLWQTANLQALASGEISLRASADLDEKPVLWQARVQTEGVRLPPAVNKELGLSRAIRIAIDAKSDKKGQITLLPKIQSGIALLERTQILYLPNKRMVRFSGALKKIRLPNYTVPWAKINGELDLANAKVTRARYQSPHETLKIDQMSWDDSSLQGRFDLRVGALDRFAPFDNAYSVSASGRLNASLDQVDISLKSEQLGPIALFKSGDTYALSGKALSLEEIYKMRAQPAMFTGDLDFSLLYSGTHLKARVRSENISPVGKQGAFRPFTLDADADLTRKQGVYQGTAKIKTSNESLSVQNMVLDLSHRHIRGDYLLDLKSIENASVQLPEPLAGALKVNGAFALEDNQRLSLHTSSFPLPVEWHRKLEANATEPLETAVEAEVRRIGDSVALKGTIKNELLSIAPLEAGLDLVTQNFSLESTIMTDLWLKDMNISAAGRFDADSVRLSQAKARSAYEELTLSDLTYVVPEQNLSASYRLKLLASTKGGTSYHSDALLIGSIQTRPRLRASMESESFEGNLSALMTDETLTIMSEKFSLPVLLAFTGQKSPIKKGSVDAYIILDAPALIDNNRSSLMGYADINVSGMLLHGTDLDGYLEKLKATQDLSLFRSDFFELPVFGVIEDVSTSLVMKQADATSITAARLKADIYRGYIQCRDCALATQKNRVAATGVVDLPRNTFHDFYVAVLNPAGCAYFVQQIKGSLDDPKIELAVAGIKVIGGAVESVASNVGDAARIGTEVVGKSGRFVGNIVRYVPIVGDVTDKTVTTITGAPSQATMTVLPGKCTPFYKGSIAHPEVGR